jgi:hypothetical protein
MARCDVLVTAHRAESNLDARDTGSTRAEDLLAERVARDEMDNDELLLASDVAVRVALPALVFRRRQMTEMPGRSSDG